jgi:SNF2 family DNA or RNA helicase
MARLLREASPDTLDLTDIELEDLLLEGSEVLASTGVEVLWPAELFGGGLAVRTTATPTPSAVAKAGFTMESLLDFRWQVTLDGEVLTQAEVDALAEAKRPMVRLRGRWVATDPELLARLRRPPRRQPVSGAQALAAALTGSITVDGEAVPFDPPAALADAVAALAAGGAQVAVPADLQATLRPYQQRGLNWLAHMTSVGLGGCLADDMGLGKTVQVIALHLHRRATEPEAGPTLVVCPTSLLGNWQREIERFAPGVPVRRFHGGDRHLDEVTDDEVVLATYGVVRRDAATLAGARWGLVVADEAQHVKNPLSKTARDLRTIPSAARLALTGTPVENRLTDLWALLDWTTPGLLGGHSDFRRTYAVPVERYRSEEAAAQLQRMTRPFLLRRRKTDPGIAPDLPPKTETDQIVSLTAEQTTLYEAVVREALATIAKTDGIQRSGLVLKLLTELKQICNHPAQFLKQSGPLVGRSGKLAALDELLGIIGSEGDSVLVFTQYVSMARLLQTHLASLAVPSLMLHGQVPAKRREQMVAQFQNGEVPVFLLSIKAGGVGLNLTRATHVIHYDRWWNPAVEDQATDRAYRIGQDRPVQVHRLIAEGTLEDRIAALLRSKRALADAVISSGEAWVSELSDDDLRALVELGGG